MPQIGFSLESRYALPISQVIPLLKNSGFSSVSPLWSQDMDMDALANCVRDHAMTIQSLHAPHKDISLLWKPDSPESAAVQGRVMGCVQACAQFDVPIMVVHGWQGLIYTFPKEPLNFRFFDTMVEYAVQHNVTVAFENLEGEEYLQALLQRYSDQDHVGYCWDSGHDFCYPHKLDFLKEFGNRLIMTHFNDNLGLRDPNGIPSGDDDLHFLPYDGKINWEQNLRRLKAAPMQETINFEIKTRSHSTAPSDLPYVHMPLEDFFKTAGQRAQRIAKQYANTMNETP